MEMRVIFLLVIVSLPVCIQAQVRTISGTVSDATTGQTIPFAHVFISNTTIGAVTNTDGRFELTDIPEGPGQLIVSYIGYETHSISLAGRLSTDRRDLALQIKLKPREV